MTDLQTFGLGVITVLIGSGAGAGIAKWFNEGRSRKWQIEDRDYQAKEKAVLAQTVTANREAVVKVVKDEAESARQRSYEMQAAINQASKDLRHSHQTIQDEMGAKINSINARLLETERKSAKDE